MNEFHQHSFSSLSVSSIRSARECSQLTSSPQHPGHTRLLLWWCDLWQQKPCIDVACCISPDWTLITILWHITIKWFLVCLLHINNLFDLSTFWDLEEKSSVSQSGDGTKLQMTPIRSQTFLQRRKNAISDVTPLYLFQKISVSQIVLLFVTMANSENRVRHFNINTNISQQNQFSFTAL